MQTYILTNSVTIDTFLNIGESTINLQEKKKGRDNLILNNPNRKAIRKLAIQRSLTVEEIENSPPLIDEAIKKYKKGVNFLTSLNGKYRK